MNGLANEHLGQDTGVARIAVVIPSYRVKGHILSVLSRIGDEVCMIVVVDDACPDGSGKFVEESSQDPRVIVIRNEQNRGVGGATIAGIELAVSEGVDIIVKIDGDGQMDPSLIPNFIAVIASGEADYSKGNRFFEPENLVGMPIGRLVGNAGLSFLAKASTGYWNILDPTNGFFAIHSSIVRLLPMQKIAQRYFFESDLLFRLNIIGARVVDVPMYSHYSTEVSNMKPLQEIARFSIGHARNFFKRIVYSYFVRGFSIASMEFILGILLGAFGIIYGILNWGGVEPATAGTVMTAALPIILGVQLFLAFLNFDIQSVPRSALHIKLFSSSRLMRAIKVQVKVT